MYITRTITITVHATADDWQLYDLPGREDAAIALNQRFEELVNKGATRTEVRNGMCLSDYANLGATDTEVRYFRRGSFGQDISGRTMNPCPNDTDTVESLSLEIEELKSGISQVREFLNQQFDACSCDHCGQILVRKHMLAPYGLDRGSDGKPQPQSSRWFCGYCVYAACVSLGGNRPEVRERIGEWLARGYGREFRADGLALCAPRSGHQSGAGCGASAARVRVGNREIQAGERRAAAALGNQKVTTCQVDT